MGVEHKKSVQDSYKYNYRRTSQPVINLLSPVPLQFLRLTTAFFKKSRCYSPVLLRRDLIRTRIINILLKIGYVPVDLCQRPTERFVGPALKYKSLIVTCKPQDHETLRKCGKRKLTIPHTLP